MNRACTGYSLLCGSIIFIIRTHNAPKIQINNTIFIPLTFLVGVWGLNYKWMPELDWRYGYLFAWILMGVIGIVVYLYFRKKKWY